MTKRIEYSRIGFGYVGKALDMLVDHPDEAKIILASWKGHKNHEQIAEITKVPIHETLKHLHGLVDKKCAIRDPEGYALAETGKNLAEAWAAFIRTLDLNFLPPEQIKAINEIVSQ